MNTLIFLDFQEFFLLMNDGMSSREKQSSNTISIEPADIFQNHAIFRNCQVQVCEINTIRSFTKLKLLWKIEPISSLFIFGVDPKQKVLWEEAGVQDLKFQKDTFFLSQLSNFVIFLIAKLIWNVIFGEFVVCMMLMHKNLLIPDNGPDSILCNFRCFHNNIDNLALRSTTMACINMCMCLLSCLSIGIGPVSKHSNKGSHAFSWIFFPEWFCPE